MKPSRNITWNDARIACIKHGQNLVTLATPGEWERFRNLVADFKVPQPYDFYLGLQLSPRYQSTTRKSLYGDLWQWVDQRTALFLNISRGHLSDLPLCTVYNTKRRTLEKVRCFEERSARYVCEFSKYASNKSTELVDQISMRGGNETTSFKLGAVLCPAGHVTSDYMSCDSRSHCGAGDFMTSCNTAGAELPMFPCEGSRQTVHYTVVCDHVQHCSDNTDEDFCEFQSCSNDTISCQNKQCIKREQLCDRTMQCADGSDEGCWTPFRSFSQAIPPPAIVDLLANGRSTMRPMDDLESCPATHFRCPDASCLPVYLRCNGVDDCTGREDESACDSYTCPGYYRCRDSTVCLHPDHVCDGVLQCPQQDDEQLCWSPACPDACRCQGLAFVCTANFSASSHPALRYLDASGSGMTPHDLNRNFYLIALRLSNSSLRNLEALTFPNLKSLDLSWNAISYINMQSLRFMKSLKFLSLSGNPLVTVSNTALTESGTLHFEDSEPLYRNAGNSRSTMTSLKLQSLDLSQTDLRVYNGTTLSNAPDLKTLNISSSKLDTITAEGFMFNPKLEIVDVKDSHLKTFPNNLLKGLKSLRVVNADNFKLCCKAMLPDGFAIKNCHAQQDLLASCEDLLRSNTHRVFLWTFASLAVLGNAGSVVARLCLHHDGSAQGGFSVLVTNLSLADFFMGVYLAIVGVADAVYRGEYLRNDDQWKRSAACKVAGFACLLSSEVSAFVISLITLERVLVLRFPGSSFHFGRCSALVACGLVWLVGAALAATPLLPMTSQWQFYSQTSICIPLPVSNTNNYFSSVVVVLNFALFLLIAVGQVVIRRSAVCHTNNSSAVALPMSQTAGSHESTIARRLTSVAVTDFLCRFLFGLLGLLVMAGTGVPEEVSVAMAVFVLPLNSALNPFLYAYSVLMEKRRQVLEDRLLKRLQSRVQSESSRVGSMK